MQMLNNRLARFIYVRRHGNHAPRFLTVVTAGTFLLGSASDWLKHERILFQPIRSTA